MYQSGFKYSVIAVAALALGLLLNINTAHAFNYGKKFPNGKTCRVVLGQTHIHAGNAADADRLASEARAIRHWSRFVALEYGRKYANWQAADKMTMECIEDTDAGVWRCRAEAQPCKDPLSLR